MMLVLYQINGVRVINQLCHHDGCHHDLSCVGHVWHLWEEAREQTGILKMEMTGWKFHDSKEYGKKIKNCLEEKTTERRRILAGLDWNLKKDRGDKLYGRL
jgi:hypothetical protein